MTASADAPPFDHIGFAEAYAAEVQRGRSPTFPEVGVREQLLILNTLLQSHPLVACRHFAGRDEIGWGRFKALDQLRLMVLLAPAELDPCMPDAPVVTESLVCPRPGARRSLVVFTASRQQVGGSLRLVHRWLAQRDVSLIYLADLPWTYYLGPMPTFGTRLEDKIDHLHGILDGLGSRSWASFGASGGGFGAILFAKGLRARRTLTYSAPTVLRESLPRLQAEIPGLDPLLSPEGTLDLAHLLQRDASPTRIKAYFPALNEHDAAEAAPLIGVPGVEVLPVEGKSDHNLLPHMVSRGLFTRHLEWLFEE